MSADLEVTFDLSVDIAAQINYGVVGIYSELSLLEREEEEKKWRIFDMT